MAAKNLTLEPEQMVSGRRCGEGGEVKDPPRTTSRQGLQSKYVVWEVKHTSWGWEAVQQEEPPHNDVTKAAVIIAMDDCRRELPETEQTTHLQIIPSEGQGSSGSHRLPRARAPG